MKKIVVIGASILASIGAILGGISYIRKIKTIKRRVS